MMDVTTGFVFFGFPISLAFLAYLAVRAHERSAPNVDLGLGVPGYERRDAQDAAERRVREALQREQSADVH